MEEFYADVYMMNKNNFPFEILKQYDGKVVAWSMDGKEIVASGDDHAAVIESCKRMGRRDVVFDTISFDSLCVSSHDASVV